MSKGWKWKLSRKKSKSSMVGSVIWCHFSVPKLMVSTIITSFPFWDKTVLSYIPIYNFVCECKGTLFFLWFKKKLAAFVIGVALRLIINGKSPFLLQDTHLYIVNRTFCHIFAAWQAFCCRYSEFTY